jgi:hypothetical protein
MLIDNPETGAWRRSASHTHPGDNPEDVALYTPLVLRPLLLWMVWVPDCDYYHTLSYTLLSLTGSLFLSPSLFGHIALLIGSLFATFHSTLVHFSPFGYPVFRSTVTLQNDVSRKYAHQQH